MAPPRVRPLAAAALLVLLGGCAASPSGGEVQLLHVHGVAVAPGGDLLVATHHGLARGTLDPPSWEWVGTERHDLMGFTQDWVAPGTLYSSGHPANPAAFGGGNLGLRRSVDGGATWEQRSLKGEVDFHALTALPSGEGHLAGVWRGALKVSQDGGLTWTDRPAPPDVWGLAADAGGLWAATAGGLHHSPDVGVTWHRIPGLDRPVLSVGPSPDGSVLLAQVQEGNLGPVLASTDRGTTWTPVAEPRLANAATQVAFAWDRATPGTVVAALGGGTILRSTDSGASWSLVRA